MPSPFKKTPAGAAPAFASATAPAPMQQTIQPKPDSPVARPTQSAFAAARPSNALNANVLPFQDSDIETLGTDVQMATMGIVKKVTEKMSVARFGDLGDMLANVQLEADKLDPQKNEGGIIGWAKSKIFDVRKAMMKQMKSADEAFTQLADKMASHVAVHETWIADLEQLYAENFQQYQRINEIIVQGEQWLAAGTAALANAPVIDPADPDAPMKAQILRDAQARLNRLSQRIDNFRRLKVLTECNGPRLRSQQESSRNTVRTLRDYSEQVIPIIKMEFAMYLQTLDVKKSGQLSSSAQSLAETSIRRGADSAKDAMIDSATQSNTPIVSNDTMSHMRNRMLEAITAVRSIEQQSEQRRTDDAVMMSKEQAQYLTQLQNNQAI